MEFTFAAFQLFFLLSEKKTPRHDDIIKANISSLHSRFCPWRGTEEWDERQRAKES